MNVLKIVIVSFFVKLLFAITLYVPQDYKKNINIENLTIKRYKSVKDINFKNAIVMLSYQHLPLIFEKNLTIITPIGENKEYIITHRKSLENIDKIINLDFAAKILLDEVNKHYQVVKGDIKDFFEDKADAIITHSDIEKDGVYDFPLKLYGIEFNKYFIVANKKLIEKKFKLIDSLNEEFENIFNFRDDLIYKTLLTSALYLHKEIDFNKILFENYKLKEEKKEENLIVDVTSNWPPFDIYKNGYLYGIGVDFWKLIAKKAELRYKFRILNNWSNVLKDIKEKKADLTINTSETPDRKKYAYFSKPYVSFPLAIICKSNENFNSIKDIKSIAVGKNFSAEKLMKEHYPNLNYIETKTTFDALNLVINNKAQCAVDILPTILWIINKNHLMNLQIAFKTHFKFNVQIMVNKDNKDLIKKINKAIDSITPIQKQKIINKYISSVVVQKNNFNKYILALVVVIVILAGLIYYKTKIKYKRVKIEAMYDELTDILNRRGVLEKVKDIKKGSVLFFDIDHFKKFNDIYGHDFGDYVLKEIGKILQKEFRKSDIVGRWGGEEFIVVLPDTEYEVGLKLAEKLRKTIENYDFNNKKVTISIGVSRYDGNLDYALKKADEALYEAKHLGRNQVKGKE